MAIVFLSHGSDDNDVAAEIKQGLLDNGSDRPPRSPSADIPRTTRQLG